MLIYNRYIYILDPGGHRGTKRPMQWLVVLESSKKFEIKIGPQFISADIRFLWGGGGTNVCVWQRMCVQEYSVKSEDHVHCPKVSVHKTVPPYKILYFDKSLLLSLWWRQREAAVRALTQERWNPRFFDLRSPPHSFFLLFYCTVVCTVFRH
jgi:hypothetical protein